MENVNHWTQHSIQSYVYNISADFTAQLETKMDQEQVSRSELASRLNKTSGRVSQVFNNPGNLSIRVMVEYAQSLGMKVAILAYDDGDHANDCGPINPDVFVRCWEKENRPKDLFEVEEANTWATFADGLVNTGVTFYSAPTKLPTTDLLPSAELTLYPAWKWDWNGWSCDPIHAYETVQTTKACSGVKKFWSGPVSLTTQPEVIIREENAA
jgi:transcriptional regulator with XRE-family HTH domain